MTVYMLDVFRQVDVFTKRDHWIGIYSSVEQAQLAADALHDEHTYSMIKVMILDHAPDQVL